jgi:hypothetical protein
LLHQLVSSLAEDGKEEIPADPVPEQQRMTETTFPISAKLVERGPMGKTW